MDASSCTTSRGTTVIPATVSEAPYILDGLLMNEAGRKIKEQYADTGGFTDLVFATTSLLGYLFHPRIRDLASKRRKRRLELAVTHKCPLAALRDGHLQRGRRGGRSPAI